MTVSKAYDLVVVGAGPIGCRVAAEVARAGYQVAILEQKPSLGSPICCTALVSEECLGRFNLDRDLIRESFKSATIFAPKKRTISVRRERIQAHALSRPGLDQWFYLTAAQQGVEVIFNSRVTAVREESDGVTIRFAQDGLTGDIKARAVVLATGFGSTLPKGLGLKLAPDWTMGIQAEAVTTGEAEVSTYVGRNYAPGFFAWLVPTAPGSAHIGLMARRRTKACFEAFLARLRSEGKVTESTPPVFRGITLASMPRTYGNRAMVIGDLAGQVKPITGGGLYFGLLCADIAARHLATAFDCDDLSARALSAYDKEWRALLGRELRLGRYARRAFALIGDRQLEFLFGVAQRHALVERLAQHNDIGFDWHGAALSRALRLFNPFSFKERE